MSDLHLEVGQQYESFDFPVQAPYLVLGGDIGRLIDYEGYLGFLRRQVARYERVLLVLGNHEFYGTSLPEGVRKARELERESILEGKVTLLQQGRYDLDVGTESVDPGITILGCVLWSQIAPDSAERIAAAVSDFKQIQDWAPDVHNAAHAADLSWLQAELERIREEDKGKPLPRQVVIVTHHAPLIDGTASPRHDDSPFRTAFSTDICMGTSWSAARYWIFGHTHWTTGMTARNGVCLVSNQRGYVFPGKTRPIDQGTLELSAKHVFDPSRCIQL